MADETGLIIRIKADTAGVENAFVKVGASTKQVVDAFAKIDQGAGKAGVSLNTVAAVSSKVSSGASSMAKAAALAGGSIGKVGNASGAAGQALGNLSRIAQDGAFGFIGIANNLNPLLESFQRLRAASGTTGGALKALGASLMGAGGIGLALGAFQFVALGGIDTIKKFFTSVDNGKKVLKEQRAALQEAKEALDDYVESLGDSRKVDLLGTQNAQAELVTLKTLYDAATNLNIPIAQRKRLVDELQSQYPAYFGNIKDETILAGGAKDAYDRLATSILNSGRARAGQELLVAKQKEVLTIEQQLADARGASAAANAKAAQEASRIRNLNATDLALNTTIQRASLNASIEQEASAKRVNDLLDQRTELHRGIASIQNKINQIAEADPTALIKPGANLPKATGQDKQKAFEFLFDFLPFDPNGKLKPEGRSKLLDAADKFSKEFGGILEGADFRLQPGVRNDDDVIDFARSYWDQIKGGVLRLKPAKLIDDITVQFPDIKVTGEPNLQGLKDAFQGVNNLGTLFTGNEQRDAILTKYEVLFSQIGLALPEIVKDKLGKPIAVKDLSLLDLGGALQANLDLVKNFVDSVNNSIQNDLIGGFSDIGSSLGQALAEGVSPLQAIAGSILETVGSFIQQIGKALVQYGIVKTGLDKVLKAGFALPGGVAIAIGVGAIAIGQLIKATKPRAFAEGGIISGPTVGLMGEYAGAKNNPEVVAPLDRLKSLLGDVGGGEFTFNGNFRIAGNDLVLAYNRNVRRQGRNF